MAKTYQEALTRASLLLSNDGIDEDGARYVLEVRNGFTPSQLRLRARDPIPAAVSAQFDADVARLLAGEPAQYIVGVAPFAGDWFAVDSRVLIPRFETEELVAWVVADQASAKRGLDVGTGSGVIGLTLARELPQVEMTLSDVSPDALAVAKSNAEWLGRKVTFIQSDLVAALAGANTPPFDFVVANLPYIDRSETAVMDASTLAHEPALALFAKDGGLALIARLLQTVSGVLRPGGALYLEFGYQQQPALADLIKRLLPQVQAAFRRDMAGHPRMVRVILPAGA